MGYNLLFFKEKTNEISLDDVISFFSDKKNFIVKPLNDDYYQFVYHNEETTTSFVIVYNTANELNTDIQFDEQFEYCYTFFTINYIRPTFYALEAMPFIEAFSKKFNLFIYDAQSLIEEKNTLKLYTKETLIESYIQNNIIACKEYNEQIPLFHTTRDKTDYYYHYTIQKEHLEDTLDVVVPDLSFIKQINSNEVYTVFSWDNFTPTLIPKCDFILLITYKKGFLGLKKQQTSLIPYDKMLSFVEQSLEKTTNELGLLVLKEDNIPQEIKDQIPVILHDDYDIVSADEVVDALS